jgi:hypothetical protein
MSDILSLRSTRAKCFDRPFEDLQKWVGEYEAKVDEDKGVKAEMELLFVQLLVHDAIFQDIWRSFW